MRDSFDVCGCFPTGRHYPGIAQILEQSITQIQGLSNEFDPSGIWKDLKLAVIDLETTGLSAEEDRIIEVGVVCLDKGKQIELKNWLVNPGIPVPKQAQEIHKITDQELAEAPSFQEITDELCEILKGRLPVAYNADFDRGFLLAEYNRLSPDALPDADLPPALQKDIEWIDPLVWVRELQQSEKSKRLTDVCARLGIPLVQAHRAAGDAEATGTVLLTLAPQLPATYGELIRLQQQYAARQEIDMAKRRRGR